MLKKMVPGIAQQMEKLIEFLGPLVPGVAGWLNRGVFLKGPNQSVETRMRQNKLKGLSL